MHDTPFILSHRRLRRKSVLLTGYLEALLHRLRLVAPVALADGNRGVEIVTPSEPASRGCQLSLRVVNPDGVEPMTMKRLNEGA